MSSRAKRGICSFNPIVTSTDDQYLTRIDYNLRSQDSDLVLTGLLNSRRGLLAATFTVFQRKRCCQHLSGTFTGSHSDVIDETVVPRQAQKESGLQQVRIMTEKRDAELVVAARVYAPLVPTLWIRPLQ